MSDTHTQVFYGSLISAAGLLVLPLLGELVVTPAYRLGWNTAELCAAFISNGFVG